MVECKDKNCPIHGTLRVRGGRLVGKVVSGKAKNTVAVERPTIQYFSKFQRWARETSHIAVHNPSCIHAKIGDKVLIGETRKISKTKAWVVMEVLGRKGA